MPRIWDPTVQTAAQANALAPRLPSLRGKRLGLLDNGKKNADVLLRLIARRLEAAGAQTAVTLMKPNISRVATEEQFAELANSCDFVVTGVGD
jgi:hypothetical protein